MAATSVAVNRTIMSGQIGRNHINFSFQEIREATGAIGSGRGAGNGSVVGITTDSRHIERRDLFIALPGERFDGHDFVAQAKKIGALTLGTREADFIVPDSVIALGKLAHFHRRRFHFPVVAITGSYGKTSTRALVESALVEGDNQLAVTKGNFNNEIGLPLSVLSFNGYCDGAVLEMGMRGRGQIDYLAKIAEPTVGVITNIGPQHIELLGSVEEIAAAKAELLENLPENGLAVLPADSPFLDFLMGQTKCKAVTFGTAVWADYRVQNITTRADGHISCEINGHTINLPLPGAHNATNAAAAFAVALELGVDAAQIVAGLEKAELPGARMRVEKLQNGITLIDDCYNAGPDSTRAALQTLLDFPGSGRRVAVLGAMKELGAHSEAEHRKIGALAGQFVEFLIGVGGDTRPLLDSAVRAAKAVENEMPTFYCDDAAEAAGRVGEWLQSGDVLLVKGSRSVGLEVVVEAVKGI